MRVYPIPATIRAASLERDECVRYGIRCMLPCRQWRKNTTPFSKRKYTITHTSTRTICIRMRTSIARACAKRTWYIFLYLRVVTCPLVISDNVERRIAAAGSFVILVKIPSSMCTLYFGISAFKRRVQSLCIADSLSRRFSRRCERRANDFDSIAICS